MSRNVDISVTVERLGRILDKALAEIEGRIANGEQIGIEPKDAAKLVLQMQALKASGMLTLQASDEGDLDFTNLSIEDLGEFRRILMLATKRDEPSELLS
jgi:hypothetical protein